MKNDYRNTKYNISEINIIERKKELDKRIREECPKVKVIYNKISKKGSDYNKQFIKIYNNKCAYCGISTEVISSDLFEIDHFICESSFNGDKIRAGELNNLVLSCKKCNRGKSDLKWSKEYNSKFNVDDQSISKLFFRDEDYYIRIEHNFIEDNTICNFYEKLKYHEEVRRLDFLLMNLYGFREKHHNDDILKKISDCIIILQKKRNELY